MHVKSIVGAMPSKFPFTIIPLGVLEKENYPVIAYLRIILRDKSQTVSSSPQHCSSLTLYLSSSLFPNSFLLAAWSKSQRLQLCQKNWKSLNKCFVLFYFLAKIQFGTTFRAWFECIFFSRLWIALFLVMTHRLISYTTIISTFFTNSWKHFYWTAEQVQTGPD